MGKDREQRWGATLKRSPRLQARKRLSPWESLYRLTTPRFIIMTVVALIAFYAFLPILTCFKPLYYELRKTFS